MTETAPEPTPAEPAADAPSFPDPTVPPTEEERTSVGEPVTFPDPTVAPTAADGDEDADAQAGEEVDDDDLDDSDEDPAANG